MVELPQIDAGSASSLVAKCLQLAKKEEKKLSGRALEARDELAAAVAGLNGELNKTLPTSPAGGTVAEPEKEENASWTSVELILSGQKGMPSDGDHPAIAERLYTALYSDGLQFLRGSPHKRWSATQTRAALLHEKSVAADFATLGMAALIATLLAKHRATGEALGFTVALTPIETPQIRVHFDAVKAALRNYILQVAASADAKKPASVALAQQLLEPIGSYEPPPRARPASGPSDKKAAGRKSGEDKAADGKAGESPAGAKGEGEKPAAEEGAPEAAANA